jgi:hypothetical protein
MRRPILSVLLGAAVLTACSSAPPPAPAEETEPALSPAAANEKLGGFWLLSVERGGQSIDHSLHIELTAGELVGSLTGPDGNSRELSRVVLAGNKVSWEIGSSSQGGAVQKYEGKLTGPSSMEGSVKWVRGQGGARRGGGHRGGNGSGDSGDGSGSSSGEGTAPADEGGGGSSGYSGHAGHGGRGFHGGRGGRGGGTTVTWRAYKSVEPPPQATPPPPKPGASGS